LSARQLILDRPIGDGRVEPNTCAQDGRSCREMHTSSSATRSQLQVPLSPDFAYSRIRFDDAHYLCDSPRVLTMASKMYPATIGNVVVYGEGPDDRRLRSYPIAPSRMQHHAPLSLTNQALKMRRRRRMDRNRLAHTRRPRRATAATVQHQPLALCPRVGLASTGAHRRNSAGRIRAPVHFRHVPPNRPLSLTCCARDGQNAKSERIFHHMRTIAIPPLLRRRERLAMLKSPGKRLGSESFTRRGHQEIFDQGMPRFGGRLLWPRPHPQQTRD
jgi:hypothetical protein